MWPWYVTHDDDDVGVKVLFHMHHALPLSTKHNFKTYSGHEALTSATIFKKCGVKYSFAKQFSQMHNIF